MEAPSQERKERLTNILKGIIDSEDSDQPSRQASNVVNNT